MGKADQAAKDLRFAKPSPVGAGGVGSLAIQLAKPLGAHVTTPVSTQDTTLVEEIGAHAVIDYWTTDFSSHIGNMDAVIDTIGGDVQEASSKTIMRGRSLVALAQPPSQKRAEAYRARAKVVFTQPSGEILATIDRLIDSGLVRPLQSALTTYRKRGVCINLEKADGYGSPMNSLLTY
jgi:NADPH:quinone reductase-like Zn-dependent oxidoreductase